MGDNAFRLVAFYDRHKKKVLYSKNEFDEINKTEKIHKIDIYGTSLVNIYYILNNINRDNIIQIVISYKSSEDKLLFDFDFPYVESLIISGFNKIIITLNLVNLICLAIGHTNKIIFKIPKTITLENVKNISLIGIKKTNISFISSILFPNLSYLYLDVYKINGILYLYTQKLQITKFIINENPQIKFYDLPYKKHLPAKRKFDIFVAKKLIKLADVYKIVCIYIDNIYTKQLIGQIKKFSNHCDDYKTYKIGKFSDI